MGSPANQVFLAFALMGVGGAWYIDNGGINNWIARPTNNQLSAVGCYFLALAFAGYGISSYLFELHSTVNQITGTIVKITRPSRGGHSPGYTILPGTGPSRTLYWDNREAAYLVSIGEAVDIRFNHYSERIVDFRDLKGSNAGWHYQEPVAPVLPWGLLAAGGTLGLIGTWKWFGPKPAASKDDAIQNRIDLGPGN